MTLIYVRTQFTAFHRFKDAPDSVAFLREWHRHIFHVKVYMEVDHDNREIEFFELKGRVDGFLRDHYEGKHHEKSCEQFARQILEYFGAKMVKVSEDGENGAVVMQPAEPAVDYKHYHVSVVVPLKEGHPRPTHEEFLNKADELQVEVVPARDQVEASKAYWFEKVLNPQTPPPQKRDKAHPKIVTSPPHLGVRTRCFVGIEAEGPHRGKKTLFVPGKMRPRDVAMAYLTTAFVGGVDIEHIYYGAGNDRDCSLATFQNILRLAKIEDIPVTVELDDKSSHPEMYRHLNQAYSPGRNTNDPDVYDVTVVIWTGSQQQHPPKAPWIDFIKWIDGELINWQSCRNSQRYVTHLTDPLFAQDRDV